MSQSLDEMFKRQRRQLDGSSELLILLTGLVCVPLYIGPVFLPFITQNALCPPSTFRTGMWDFNWVLYWSCLCLWTLFLATFSSYVLVGCGLVGYSGASGPAPPARYVKEVMACSALGLIISGPMLINSASHLYCVTPSDIIFRSGYLETPRVMTWGDMDTVRAWCEIANPPKHAPFQAADLTFLFRDGEQLTLGLTLGGQNHIRDYEIIKSALRGRDYHYYVNSTVNPHDCPPEFYLLLRNWPND